MMSSLLQKVSVQKDRKRRKMALIPWCAHVLTLFPDMFPGPLAYSVIGRGLSHKLWRLNAINIRDFSKDKHGRVDDTPFGGGPGMVLQPQPINDAVESVVRHAVEKPHLIYMTPRGEPLNQHKVLSLSKKKEIIILCGHYEGVDQRVLDTWDFEEISIGDYILCGGETAAMVLLEAVVRLLPGIVGAPESLVDESFKAGLLEYPHYTRPQVWEGQHVPEVLTSGNHRNIEIWRKGQAEIITEHRRPDLWKSYCNKSQQKA